MAAPPAAQTGTTRYPNGPPHSVQLPGAKQMAILKATAKKWGVSFETLLGVYGTETGYGTNDTTSSAGAEGPFQFEPATAKQYGLADPWDFATSADAAGHYLHDLGANTDINSTATAKALNSYNGNGGGAATTDYVTRVRLLGQGLGKTINPNDPFNPDVIPGAVSGAVSSVADTISSVPKFLSKLWDKLTSQQFWINVGKILIGLVAILLGVRALTGKSVDLSSLASPKNIQSMTEGAGLAA